MNWKKKSTQKIECAFVDLSDWYHRWYIFATKHSNHYICSTEKRWNKLNEMVNIVIEPIWWFRWWLCNFQLLSNMALSESEALIFCAIRNNEKFPSVFHRSKTAGRHRSDHFLAHICATVHRTRSWRATDKQPCMVCRMQCTPTALY